MKKTKKTDLSVIPSQPVPPLEHERSHIITAIHDCKSGLFLSMNIARNENDFIRTIQVECKNPNSMLKMFPADYDLYVMGEWSEKAGIMNWEKRRIGSCLDLCPQS